MTRARDLSEIVNSTGLSVDTDTLVVDSANNRVGIGTSSPGYSLQVQETSPIIAVQSTGVNTSRLLLSAENDAVYIGTTYGGSNIPIIFSRGGTSSGAASMTIDASGNVGIGASTGERLTVSATNPTDGRVASLRNIGTSGLTGTKLWFNQNTVDNWNIGQPAGVNAFVFCNSTDSGLERMRIDASGNLLVGNTVANPASGFNNQKGLAYTASSGKVEIATTADAPALEIGKNNANDGDLVTFRKLSFVVGSLGAGNGDLIVSSRNAKGFKIYAPNADGTNSIIHPSTDEIGNPLDAKMDLGYVLGRFKDLYLSGGVYLGGTGAANKLEDYEEGNFTPVVSGTSTTGAGTYTIQSGKYVIVGKMVYVSVRLGWTAHTGSGNMIIASLPTTANVEYANLGVVFRDGLTVSSGHTVNVGVVPSTNYANILEISTGTDNASIIALDTAVSDLAVSGWYQIA